MVPPLLLTIPSPVRVPERSPPLLECLRPTGYSRVVNAQFAPIFQLSRQEKLQLIEELWDSIAQEESQQPLAQWKVDELIRRKEAFEKDPSKARTWEQVKASILGQNA
jgi:putative addiction module component (TIGR02574 family)